MLRFRNGLGWLDTASGQCALPPDGEKFAIAPGAEVQGVRGFHIIEVPPAVAVIRTFADDVERTRVQTLLASHVLHTAFVHEDRDGFARVSGDGPSTILATAVAAWKVIGGWDESSLIAIVVNDERIELRLMYDGHRWTVDVMP